MKRLGRWSVRSPALACPYLAAMACLALSAWCAPLEAKPPDLQPMGDVSLRSDGGLEGRVLVAAAGQTHQLPGSTVVLLRDGRPAAEATTDAEGRFRVGRLTGGVYQVAVRTPRGTYAACFRVWTASSAPPGAAPQCRLVLVDREPAVVRGQSIPGLGASDLVALAGLVAGGITAPIIYGSKQDVWIPATP